MDINFPKPPSLRIFDDYQRILLTLTVSDGKLKAEYDPEDLDEAAKILIDQLKLIANEE